MDWSASNEVIETLESTINGVPVNNSRGEREDGDGDGDGDGDDDEEVPDIVEEVFSMVYEAGEKLYASFLNWAPWKSDPNLPLASSSDLASHLGERRRRGREIELSERDPSVWGRSSITETGQAKAIDPAAADREPAVHKTALRGRNQVVCEMSGKERMKMVHGPIPRRCDPVPCKAPLRAQCPVPYKAPLRAQCPAAQKTHLGDWDSADGAGPQKHPKCPL